MTHEFVVVGDLHLEKLDSYFDRDTALSYSFNTLEKVVAYCNKRAVTHVVQVGDLTDTPFPKQATVKRLIQFFLKHSHIHWDIILGNHDYASVDVHSMELCKFMCDHNVSNVTIHTEPHIKKIDGVRLCFMPYPHFKPPKKPSICFGHFETKGSRLDNGKLVDCGYSRKNLGKHNYWILGHLHTYQKSKGQVFVGTLSQMSFGESSSKGFLHVTAKKPNIVDYTYISIVTPYTFENVVLESNDCLKKFGEDWSETALYKIFIRGGFTPPSDFSSTFPNIHSIVGYGKNQKKLLGGEQGIGGKDNNISPTLGLKDFLVERGVKKKDCKRAIAYVNKLIGNL